MVVPLIGRWLAAVVGGLLVLTVWGSVIGTLIVPRPVGSRLTRWVDRLVSGAFSLVTTAIAWYCTLSIRYGPTIALTEWPTNTAWVRSSSEQIASTSSA